MANNSGNEVDCKLPQKVSMKKTARKTAFLALSQYKLCSAKLVKTIKATIIASAANP